MKRKIEMLKSYMISNAVPIMVDFDPSNIFNNAIVIPADCGLEYLYGYYYTDYITPLWFKDINKDKVNIIIIQGIDKIDIDEQTNFYELAKYKKVGTNILPSNSRIIFSVSSFENKICNDLNNLLAKIGA